MCSTLPSTSQDDTVEWAWSVGGWDENTDGYNCSEEDAKGVGGAVEGLGEVTYSPDLTSVYSSLKWGFILHAYGFACLFFFLAFYSFFSILNLRSQLSTRPYMTTINSFLCLLGASRSAVLFIDPYGLKHTLPVLIGSLLWDLGFPSLISSFSLIQIAFLQLTQEGDEVGSGSRESFGKKTCLSIIITLHFMSVIISAVCTNFNPHLMLVKLLTELVFAIWGFILCGSFAYAGKRVLGILGGNETSTGSSQNEKGIANLFGMGMLAPGPGQNLASSLTAALAPTLLQSVPNLQPTTLPKETTLNVNKDASPGSKDTPKIKIIDENERIVNIPTHSTRLLNDIPEGGVGSMSGGRGRSGSGCAEGYVRPPSPVLPRRKSSGPGLRTHPFTCRRPSRGEDEGIVIPCDKDIRKKSLTWSELDPDKPSSSASSDRRSSASRKSMDLAPADPTDRGGGMESLLSAATGGGGPGGPDYTLQSILSHIAYVNQTALDYRLSRKLSRKNQVEKVMKYTSLTAFLGFILCIGELIRIIGPYGLLASSTSPLGVWPWFILQTLCRLTEFGMGATVANIAKQPSSRPHHYAYSIRHKHHRESMYL